MPTTHRTIRTEHTLTPGILDRTAEPQNIEFSHPWLRPLNLGRQLHNSDYTTSGNEQSAISTITTKPNSSFVPHTSLHLQHLYNHTRVGAGSLNTSSDQTASHAAAIESINPTTSNPQSWSSSSVPFPDFEFHPTLDLAEEFDFEPTATFEQFRNPAGSHSSDQQGIDLQAQFGSQDNSSHHPGLGAEVFSHPEQILPRSALKRKSYPQQSVTESSKSSDWSRSAERTADPRKTGRVTFEEMSSVNAMSPEEESSSDDGSSAKPQSKQAKPSPNMQRNSSVGTPNNAPVGKQSTAAPTSQRQNHGSKDVTGHPPAILPPEKVFPIQIGSELFRLSGASISSDAPSYFTQFFEDQLKQLEESGGVRTLYIDRDPETFRDVARHLQGYHVKPKDGSHFVKLFADAQFYQLPRLIDQLFESEIYIQIGEQQFQIPKDVFSAPGNSPNFFSLGFAVFFSSPGEVFPGLDRRGLLRPPSISPPYVGGRSAKTFAQLLHLLRGYPLSIENETHRAELLRDCRYYHLRGLEQKIIAHNISYNMARGKTEISLRIEDVKPSGVSYKAEEGNSSGGWVQYARPFVDDAAYELIIEMSGESTLLDINAMRLDFHGLAKARISSLLQVVANKMNLPTKAPLGLMVLSGASSSHSASPGNTPLSEDRVKVRFDSTTDTMLDGERFIVEENSRLGKILLHGPDSQLCEDDDGDSNMSTPSLDQSVLSRSHSHPTTHTRKRRRLDSATVDEDTKWMVRSGQWRLKVQNNPQAGSRNGFEIVFIAVKIDAFSNERARNARREFFAND